MRSPIQWIAACIAAVAVLTATAVVLQVRESNSSLTEYCFEQGQALVADYPGLQADTEEERHVMCATAVGNGTLKDKHDVDLLMTGVRAGLGNRGNA